MSTVCTVAAVVGLLMGALGVLMSFLGFYSFGIPCGAYGMLVVAAAGAVSTTARLVSLFRRRHAQGS